MDAEDTVATLLDQLGFVGDPEMTDSPRRVVEWLSAFVPTDEPLHISVCATSSTTPVCMDGIPFHSLCAHHLVPFFGTVSIAYVPHHTLAGLGSLSRAVTHFASRPQLQERMGEQIADHLFSALQPEGLVVRIEARQLCVELSQHLQPNVRTWAIRGDLPEGLQPRW